MIENMQYAAIVLHDVPAGPGFLRERTHDLARKGVIAPDLSNVQSDPKDKISLGSCLIVAQSSWIMNERLDLSTTILVNNWEQVSIDPIDNA